MLYIPGAQQSTVVQTQGWYATGDPEASGLVERRGGKQNKAYYVATKITAQMGKREGHPAVGVVRKVRGRIVPPPDERAQSAPNSGGAIS